MKEIPNQENKFTCENGETVTFTFRENNTVPLVTAAFISPAGPASVDPNTKKLVFKVTQDTVLVITYVFTNPSGGSYDIKASGSKGGNFPSRVNQPIGRKISNRTYTFGIV